MTTIAFYNNKGGVGKTTTAINVANELAEKHRILVIDLDGQANYSVFGIVLVIIILDRVELHRHFRMIYRAVRVSLAIQVDFAFLVGI